MLPDGRGERDGRATALAAAAEGAVLFLTDLDAAGLEDTVRDVRAAGGQVAAHRALDVSDYEAVRAFAGSLHEDFGSMDVVMNIAGISVWGAVDTLEHRHWRQVIEVNLMGPIHVIESFATSNDTRIGYWFQRKFGFVYERTMRRLNDRFYALAKPLPPARGHGRLAESSAE